MARPEWTQQEKDDRSDARKRFWQEAIRLSKKKEVKAFIEQYCERVDVDENDFGLPDAYYQITGRQQNKRLNILKDILRDNIKPSLVNENVPHAWPDLSEKISLLVPAVFRVSIPLSEKPWFGKGRPGRGNQGQGQGRGNGPN